MDFSVNRPRCALFSGICSGVIIGSYGFASTYADFLTVTAFFGFVYPGHYAHSLTILGDMIPNQFITDFVTINVFLIGIGTFAVAIFGGEKNVQNISSNSMTMNALGLMKDKLGNYVIGFFVVGVLQSFSCILFAIDSFRKRSSSSADEVKKCSTDSETLCS